MPDFSLWVPIDPSSPSIELLRDTGSPFGIDLAGTSYYLIIPRPASPPKLIYKSQQVFAANFRSISLFVASATSSLINVA
jgi:hypothetical protein